MNLSLEGHYGRVLARGLSANSGLHHEDARVNVNGVNLIDSEGTRPVVSLWFTF